LTNLNSINLTVAGFKLQIISDVVSFPIALEKGYLSFESGNISQPDLIVRAHNFLPDLKRNEVPVFEAREGNETLWKIYFSDNIYKIVTFNPALYNEIQQIAICKNNFSECDVYMNPIKKKESKTEFLCPLLYPLGPLLLYYQTIKTDSIMIHASGIFDGEKGRLFTGFSGAGKSTISNLWKQNGSILINDDRLIIRKINNRYIMFKTPMFYPDEPKQSPLDKIYSIRHFHKNKSEKLDAASAVSQVLSHCIQHPYNLDFINHHLAFVSELCNSVDVYNLGFLPDNSVIEHIKNLN